MENYNNINWKEECEGFTSVYPEKTDLAVKLMLDDCNSAANFRHPVVVFMQNSYDTEDFYAKVAITADENAENIFNTEIKIRHRDYMEVRLWIMKHWKLIHRLSRMEIDIFGFSEELEKYELDDIDDSLNESFDAESMLFEMAILKGNITGLDYNIWIDNDHTWETSGHSPRLKIQDSNRSADTRNWNPFIFDTMDFADACKKDAGKYSAKSRKNIMTFINANIDFIKEITCGERKYTDDEIKKEILTLDEIKKGFTRESRDKNVVMWRKNSNISNVYGYSSGSYVTSSGETIYAIIDSKTHENAFSDNRTFAAIIPIAHKDEKGTYVLVYPRERESEYTLEKQYLPEET